MSAIFMLTDLFRQRKRSLGEILVKEGGVLAANKVRRSIEKIYNLGFIEGAEPQILPTGSPNIMDLMFNITEGKPGMITAGAGYSSVDYFVGSLQFQHMNLFGLAQRQFTLGVRCKKAKL